MIAYRRINGIACDIRLVVDGYKALLGEVVIAGDQIPSQDSLSDSVAVAARDAQAELAGKRRAALRALEDQKLAAALVDPTAPAEVKDYQAALASSGVIKVD
jgi:hypothetical protein